MALYRDDNTDGYTQHEMDCLNEEFWQRWLGGPYGSEWKGIDLDDAAKAFAHEVAQR